MRVKVTKDDFALGERWHPTECPVARAIRRAVPGSCPVVGYDAVYLQGQRLPLPRKAREVVRAVDSGWRGHLRPIEFTLNVRKEGGE